MVELKPSNSTIFKKFSLAHKDPTIGCLQKAHLKQNQ